MLDQQAESPYALPSTPGLPDSGQGIDGMDQPAQEAEPKEQQPEQDISDQDEPIKSQGTPRYVWILLGAVASVGVLMLILWGSGAFKSSKSDDQSSGSSSPETVPEETALTKEDSEQPLNP